MRMGPPQSSMVTVRSSFNQRRRWKECSAKYEGKAGKIGVVVGFFPTHLFFVHTLPTFGEECDIAQSVVWRYMSYLQRVLT